MATYRPLTVAQDKTLRYWINAYQGVKPHWKTLKQMSLDAEQTLGFSVPYSKFFYRWTIASQEWAHKREAVQALGGSLYPAYPFEITGAQELVEALQDEKTRLETRYAELCFLERVAGNVTTQKEVQAARRLITGAAEVQA